MQVVRFDPKPSQDGEKDKKKEEKSEKKFFGSEQDLNSRPSDYRSCT